MDGTGGWDGTAEAKEAQIENAVWHVYLGDGLVSEQQQINIKGITSKKAGPIAETYDRNLKATKDALNGIYTTKVYEILKNWLTDSRIGI